MDNQHRKISGYRELSQTEIDTMNAVKRMEQAVGELHRLVGKLPGADGRAHALARTKLQEGFMWLVRSIAKPTDPFEG